MRWEAVRRQILTPDYAAKNVRPCCIEYCELYAFHFSLLEKQESCWIENLERDPFPLGYAESIKQRTHRI